MELGSTNSSCVLSCSMTEGLMVIKAQRIVDGSSRTTYVCRGI